MYPVAGPHPDRGRRPCLFKVYVVEDRNAFKRCSGACHNPPMLLPVSLSLIRDSCTSLCGAFDTRGGTIQGSKSPRFCSCPVFELSHD